jgi:hypothetical protein
MKEKFNEPLPTANDQFTSGWIFRSTIWVTIATEESDMRAFFVGGLTDNSELDMEIVGKPPAHYPTNTGSSAHRYRLQRAVKRDGRFLYAVYAPPEMSDSEVDRIISERDYARRFSH